MCKKVEEKWSAEIGQLNYDLPSIIGMLNSYINEKKRSTDDKVYRIIRPATLSNFLTTSFVSKLTEHFPMIKPNDTIVGVK